MNRNLLKQEEELILEQLRIEQELVKVNILNKLNMAEQLIGRVISPETFSITFETAESLGKGLSLPLKVRGAFLTEGRPQRKHYSKEELRKAVERLNNHRFPIMQDHRDKETSTIIGVVDRLEYSDSITCKDGSIRPGILWWGHLNDETSARNVLDNMIKEVSVTVFSDEYLDAEHGISGRNLSFSELSTVIGGADAGNFIVPV